MPSTDTRSSALIAIAAGVGAFTAMLVLRRALNRRLGRGAGGAITVERDRLIALRSEWRPPAELASRSTPRDVTYTLQGRMIIGAIAFVIVGLIVAVAFLYPQLRRERAETDLVQRDGTVTLGTVLDRTEHHGRNGSTYEVLYEYVVNGHRYHATARVRGAYYPRYALNAPVPVRYSAARPDVSRIEGTDSESPWVAFVLLLPACILLVVPFSLVKQKQLLASGTVTSAIVTRVRPVRGGMSIRFAFLDASGNQLMGSGAVGRGVGVNAGDVITAVYDPERPRRNWQYPMAAVRIAD